MGRSGQIGPGYFKRTGRRPRLYLDRALGDRKHSRRDVIRRHRHRRLQDHTVGVRVSHHSSHISPANLPPCLVGNHLLVHRRDRDKAGRLVEAHLRRLAVSCAQQSRIVHLPRFQAQTANQRSLDRRLWL